MHLFDRRSKKPTSNPHPPARENFTSEGGFNMYESLNSLWYKVGLLEGRLLFISGVVILMLGVVLAKLFGALP